MAVKKQTYDEAIKKLKQIVAQVEDNELDIDSLGVKLKEAQELIKYCKERLYKADEEIKKILEQTDRE